MSKQELMEIALALPLPERVELAQALWQSIDGEPGPNAAAEERVAIELAVERDLELTSGRVAGRTHEQVMEAARMLRSKSLRRHGSTRKESPVWVISS